MSQLEELASERPVRRLVDVIHNIAVTLLRTARGAAVWVVLALLWTGLTFSFDWQLLQWLRTLGSDRLWFLPLPWPWSMVAAVGCDVVGLGVPAGVGIALGLLMAGQTGARRILAGIGSALGVLIAGEIALTFIQPRFLWFPPYLPLYLVALAIGLSIGMKRGRAAQLAPR